MQKLALAVILFVLTVALFVFADSKTGVSSFAPLTVIQTLSGESIDLLKQEKAVVLKFWATWCSTCTQDRNLVRSGQVNLSKTVVLSINVDEKKPRMGQFPPDEIHHYDESTSLQKRFNIKALPTYILLKEGLEVVRFHSAKELAHYLLKE